MNYVGQHVGRNEPAEFLKLDPLEQARASRSPLRVGGEMVNERVGIDENVGRRNQVVKAHGDSMMPNSSSSASRRSVSQSLRQRSMPADSRATLCFTSTATRTLVWS